MLTVISAIKDFLISRFGIAIIGLIAICSVVWFGAPRLGLINPWLRAEIIAGIILLYLVVMLLRWLWGIRARW